MIKQKVKNKKRETGLVVALSVTGFILGLTGMFGSVIPCIGSLALYLTIPAVLISAASLFLAHQKESAISFPVAALTVSIIGLTISGIQYFTISKTLGATKAAFISLIK